MKTQLFLSIGLFILILGSCASTKNPGEEKLYGTTWQLEYMSGPRIAFEGLFPDKKPEIMFNKATSEVTGNNSCNGYTAEYALDGKSISFGEPGPTTMRYCGEGEPQFLNMMKKIDGYSFDADGKLNLMIGDVPMMRFKKIQKDGVSGTVEQPGNINSEITKGSKVPTDYFKASGTEPFWGLSIDEEHIVFRTPTDSITMPHTDPDLAQDSNVKRYDVATGSGRMVIQISQTDCTNAMSGAVSPYSVTIEQQNADGKETEKLEGCGRYITDYRLHDIWVLETLNGKTVTKDDFGKEIPSMEINAAENKFMGFAGCNRMNGTLFFEKDLLRFTNVATTKMMCEPNNKEVEFLKALQSGTSYTIENNRLTLSNPSGVLSVFKKVE